VTAQYLVKNVIKDISKESVYVIGEQGLKKELSKAGIRVVNPDDETRDDSFMSESEFAGY